jgi:hypothetical protein
MPTGPESPSKGPPVKSEYKSVPVPAATEYA